MNRLEIEAASKATALQIYKDFKWSLRIRRVSYLDIAKALDLAIESCETRIEDVVIRAKALQGFRTMRNRVAEFMVDATAEPEMCPKCNLSLFICPCPKEN